MGRTTSKSLFYNLKSENAANFQRNNKHSGSQDAVSLEVTYNLLMSLFEYLATIVALVLGLAAANLLNKFSDAITNAQWRSTGWFFSLWCMILLICLLGYFWSFWRLYSGIELFTIWEFILGPFFSVVCLFLVSVFIPIPDKNLMELEESEYFIVRCKPFYFTLALIWFYFGVSTSLFAGEQGLLEVAFGWLMFFISASGMFLKSFQAHKLLLLGFTASYLGQEAIQLAISS